MTADQMREAAIACADAVRRHERRRFDSKWHTFYKCQVCGAVRRPNYPSSRCPLPQCSGHVALTMYARRPEHPRG